MRERGALLLRESLCLVSPMLVAERFDELNFDFVGRCSINRSPLFACAFVYSHLARSRLQHIADDHILIVLLCGLQTLLLENRLVRLQLERNDEGFRSVVTFDRAETLRHGFQANDQLVLTGWDLVFS